MITPVVDLLNNPKACFNAAKVSASLHHHITSAVSIVLLIILELQ